MIFLQILIEKIFQNRFNKKHKNIPTFLCILLITFSVNAQEAVITAGGEATGSGGSVSYSVGQLVYTTFTGDNKSIAQGVQQSYEISIVSGIKLNTSLDISLTAYPNPTSDYLMLQIKDYRDEKLTYTLLDISGRQITGNLITNSQTMIQMRHLPAAAYLIHISDENQRTKTFKILKN